MCEKSDDQKKTRVKRYKETLEQFKSSSSNLVNNIVNGDESCIYTYESEKKNQFAVWVFQNEAKPTKVVRFCSLKKNNHIIFHNENGNSHTVRHVIKHLGPWINRIT